MKMRGLVLGGLLAASAGCATGPRVVSTPVAGRGLAAYTTADIKSPAAIRNGSAGLQVPGVTSAMLLPGYWTALLPDGDAVLPSADAVAALNARTWAETPSLYRLDALPEQVSSATVAQWIDALAGSAKPGLMDAQGRALGEARVEAMRANTRSSTTSAQLPVRWATVRTRADLRAVPDATRAYRKAEDISINIDRLQESAVFPGMAVAVLQMSADGQWAFVNAYNYRAWMRAEALQFVSRKDALARDAEVQPVPLPYTRANLIRSAFRYLGEAYGWGHADGTRDCSGFVSEAYAALGVVMPRNTGDQRDVSSFHAVRFTERDTRDARERAVANALPGDLIFVPGHVMMVLGRVGGETYVIHDTPGVRFKGGTSYPLYGVSVTPFSPLMFDETLRYADKIQAVVRPFE